MPSFYSNRLNWQALGYFAPPTSANDPALAADPDLQRWLKLESILAAAKNGDFSRTIQLIDLYANAETATFGFVCSRVLGDAGTTTCCRRMLDELNSEANWSPGKAYHYCSALCTSGALFVIPIVLAQYERLSDGRDDPAIVRLYMSEIMESNWGPIANSPASKSADSYRDVVMSQYHRLRDQFKTDHVTLFKGQLWSVVVFARYFLDQIANNSPQGIPAFHYRRRFEAATGIDCSLFYDDGRFQTLLAAEILETFLHSDRSSEFEPGVRYFFGHRIPD